jgi:hypothetical protein
MVNEMPNTEMDFCGKHKVSGFVRVQMFNN